MRNIRRNIIFGKNASLALFRVDSVAYEYLSKAEKTAELAAWSWFAYHIEANFLRARLTRAYPASRYAATTEELFDGRHGNRETFDMYVEGHEQHIRDMRSWEPEVYVGVQLPKRRRGDPEEDEAAAYGTFLEYLKGRRATTMEVQWWLRRAARRGIGEPDLDENWRPPAIQMQGGRFEPKSELARFTNDLPVPEARGVYVDTEAGRSYQAMLALGALPQKTLFPGGAELLFKPLEAVKDPWDVIEYVQWIPNENMQKLLRNRVKDADVAAGEDQGLSWLPEQLRIEARDAEEYYATEPYPPGLRHTAFFAGGAPSPEEREARVDRLRKRYGSVRLERPLGLQEELYYAHFPQPSGAPVKDYADIITLEQFGALMPHGTHAAGSKKGWHFGRTLAGGGRPVRQDITEASFTDDAPSWLLCGALGRGKTFTAQLVVLLSALRGSLVVDTDPKGDHRLEELAELKDRVQVIELSGEEQNRGLLDPLSVAPSMMREDLTSAYLTELLGDPPMEYRTQIRKAVKAILFGNGKAPSCLRVVDMLVRSPHEDARRAGEALEVWADSGLGRLGFGDGERAVMGAQRQVTTIRAAGITMPQASTPRSSYDDSERLAVATMKLVTGFAMRLVMDDRKTHKVHKLMHFDEAHFLLDTNDGLRLLARLNTMGRSEFVSLLLSTQLLSHVDEQIEGLIGTRVLFGQKTEAQARKVLPIMGLDPEDDKLVKMLTGFRKGECLYRGIDDRVTAMRVDPVFPHLLELLGTTVKRQEVAV